MTDRQGSVHGEFEARPGPPLIRQVNQGIVLAALRTASPLRLGEIAARTGLSRPTVGTVVDDLVEAGWVAHVEPDPRARTALGRPARWVRFRSEAGYVVGIDIGPHRTSVAVSDLAGEIRTVVRRSTSADRSKADLLAHVRAAVRDALARTGVPRAALCSVAVGSPGIVDHRSGGVLVAPGLPGWADLNLAAELRRSFRCPVHVENDVNLAVLGERWRGCAWEARSVVFVLWGERVGAGICLDGRLYRGAANAAGEIGYLTVLGGGEAGGDGTADGVAGDGAAGGVGPDRWGRGPFEREVGAVAITGLAARLGARSGGALAGLRDRLDVAEVFRAAADGDTVAVQVLDTVAGRLARGLAPLLLILDPDVLVIGGGISQAGAAALAAVRRHLRPLTLVDTPVALSDLGEDAVVTGAVRFALTDVEQRLMPAAPAVAGGGFTGSGSAGDRLAGGGLAGGGSAGGGD